MAASRGRSPFDHTFPSEAGGMTMLELIIAMKKDALEQDKVTAIVAELLEQTVTRNDSLQRASPLELFEGEKAPVKASSYVRRIMKYGGISPCCFVVGIIYLERLKEVIPTLCLTSTNFQRLFLVAVMEAAKFLDDFYFSNKHWAEVGGITTQEINALELEFLFLLEFDLNIQREEYEWFFRTLEKPRQAQTSDSPGVFGFSDRTSNSRALQGTFHEKSSRSETQLFPNDQKSASPNDRRQASPNGRGPTNLASRGIVGPTQTDMNTEHLGTKVSSFRSVKDTPWQFTAAVR